MAMRRAKPNLMNVRRKQKDIGAGGKINENCKEEKSVTIDKTTAEDGSSMDANTLTEHVENALPIQTVIGQIREEAIAKVPVTTEDEVLKENESTSGLDFNNDAVGKLESNDMVIHEEQPEQIALGEIKTEVDNTAFKYPPRLNYNRSNSVQNSENFSDIEDNVIQLDLQKSAGSPISPTKLQSRQRLRATPIFGRRNSFVGAASSPQSGDEIKSSSDVIVHGFSRERHNSASFSSNAGAVVMSSSSAHHTPHKIAPTMGFGRTRTESGCSAFSDSYGGSRKTDEPSHHRTLHRRDFETRFTDGVPDKSKLKMFDLIYYNPNTNPMEQKTNFTKIKLEENTSNNSDDIKPNPTELDTSEGSSSAVPVPQLKLNANGELILDDKSLEIETTAEQEARKTLAKSSLIYLDENTGMNGFYKRNKRTKEWQADETIKFYRCLQTVGTDFSLMCHLFPDRSRRDLKLKFKKEERCNLALINKALLYPNIFNITDLKDQFANEEREREEIHRKWKEVKSKKPKEIKKVRVSTSVSARVLKNGDDIYENEDIVQENIYKKIRKKTKPRLPNDVIKMNGSSIVNQTAIQENSNDAAKEPPNPKRRRHARKNNGENDVKDMTIISNIKTENIKIEQCFTNRHCNDEMAEHALDTNQLEYEINEILETDVQAIEGEEHNNAYIAGVNTSVGSNSNINTENKNYLGNKIYVNLDDGSLAFVEETRDILPAKIEMAEISDMPKITEAMSTSCTSVELGVKEAETQGEHELNERDIQQILSELADGNLVLVSSLDPVNGDKMLNEIYMVDYATGELYDKPLDIPEEIVEEILSVMS